MDMRLPKEVLDWIDTNRDDLSRQVFIISILDQLLKNPKNYNTKGIINEVKISTATRFNHCKTIQ